MRFQLRLLTGLMAISGLVAAPRAWAITPVMVAKGVEIAGAIVNLGKESWTLVVENQPQVKESSILFGPTTASAIPASLKNPDDIDNWQLTPNTLTYTENLRLLAPFAPPNVIVKFHINYMYGTNSTVRGHYVVGLEVIPEIETNWLGAKVDASATVSKPFGAGTAEDPVGAIRVTIRYKITSTIPVVNSTRTQTYVIYGDGRFMNTDTSSDVAVK